jgi:transcription initiation factor TFIIIB Brf1 subunit/transcription initiation factor TFIIB
MNLPSFPYREEAARRIRKEKNLLFKSQRFGKNKRATIAALLHLILRQYNKNRPLQEICEQLSLDSRLVTKQTWALNKTVIENPGRYIDVPRRTSIDYLFKYGGKVTSDTALLIEAEEILMKLQRTGGNPIAIASGALYHICKRRNCKVSKEQIAKAFGISHRTVYTNEAQIRTVIQRLSLQETAPRRQKKVEVLVVQKRQDSSPRP